MYNYMRSLQKQFETKPRFLQELSDEIRQTHRTLSARLEQEDKKLLLKLVDMEDLLHSEASLHSFISGSASPAESIKNSWRNQSTPSTAKKKSSVRNPFSGRTSEQFNSCGAIDKDH